MLERNGEASENYYISIADDTGVLRLMQLPKHLWISSDQAVRSVELKQGPRCLLIDLMLIQNLLMNLQTSISA